MFVSFLDSVKYSGYFFPLAFIRIVFGYTFVQIGVNKINQNFLRQPVVVETVSNWTLQSPTNWYVDLLNIIVIPNWIFFSYLIVCIEFLIGFSFLIGFLIRPISFLGILYSLHLIYLMPPLHINLYKIYLLFFVLTLWMSAGRCLGIDYFFYKKQRGLLW